LTKLSLAFVAYVLVSKVKKRLAGRHYLLRSARSLIIAMKICMERMWRIIVPRMLMLTGLFES